MELVTEKRIVRGAPTLVPATAFDVQRLEKIPAGQLLCTELTYQRSVQRMRYYRAFCAVVADGLGITPDAMHVRWKLRFGLVKNVHVLAKGIVIELQSCAFRTMDEAKFAEFVDFAVESAFRDDLPGVRRKDVFRRVEDLVGPRPR